MIEEKELKELVEMINWSINSDDIQRVTLSVSKDLVGVSTFHSNQKLIQGNGKTILGAMKSYTDMGRKAESVMENFNAQ